MDNKSPIKYKQEPAQNLMDVTPDATKMGATGGLPIPTPLKPTAMHFGGVGRGLPVEAKERTYEAEIFRLQEELAESRKALTRVSDERHRLEHQVGAEMAHRVRCEKEIETAYSQIALLKVSASHPQQSQTHQSKDQSKPQTSSKSGKTKQKHGGRRTALFGADGAPLPPDQLSRPQASLADEMDSRGVILDSRSSSRMAANFPGVQTAGYRRFAGNYRSTAGFRRFAGFHRFYR